MDNTHEIHLWSELYRQGALDRARLRGLLKLVGVPNARGAPNGAVWPSSAKQEQVRRSYPRRFVTACDDRNDGISG